MVNNYLYKKNRQKYWATYYKKNKKFVNERRRIVYASTRIGKKRNLRDGNGYKRQLENMKLRYKENRLKVLNFYCKNHPKCVCCDELELRFLTVDHVNNDGARHRKVIGKRDINTWLVNHNFPTGFQILCWNCNMGKARNGGVCPHKHVVV